MRPWTDRDWIPPWALAGLVLNATMLKFSRPYLWDVVATRMRIGGLGGDTARTGCWAVVADTFEDRISGGVASYNGNSGHQWLADARADGETFLSAEIDEG